MKGKFPLIFHLAVNWLKTRNCCTDQFKEQGVVQSSFFCAPGTKTLRYVCVAVMNIFTCDATSELGILGQIISSLDLTVPIVPFVGDWKLLSEIYSSNIGSANYRKLIDSPVFTLRLHELCMQKSLSSSLLGTLDALSVTEFLVTRLKGAEIRDWMMSQTALRKAVRSGDLTRPGVLEIVANIVRVWPLIASYLMETGKKDGEDSFVV